MSQRESEIRNELAAVYWNANEDRSFRHEEACPWDEWLSGGSTGAAFAIHPRGFPVFVPAARLAASDEYANGDPYLVAEGMEGQTGFQSRRFATTLELLATALQAGPSSARDRPRILDVACGAGHLTAAIRKEFPQASLCGIDYSVSAIARAVDTDADIEFCCGDAYALPYPDKAFDVVVLNNIWEHVPDPLRLLDGVKRVLARGGHVVVSTPSRYRFGNMVRVLLGRPVMFMSKHHVTEYTVGQVLEQFRFAGMTATVVDRPLAGPADGVLTFLAYKVASPILRVFLKLIGSHHSLEQTVFYLARMPD